MILFLFTGSSFWQLKKNTYYLVDLGCYVELENMKTIIKVPYKENHEFYFSLKNDTTALIKEKVKGRIGESKEYKISPKLDTAYIKRYSSVNGQKKLKIDKIIFKRVYL